MLRILIAMYSLKTQNIAKLVGLVVLVAGLVVGVYLVGQRVFFAPRASGEYIRVLDQDGNPLLEENGVPVTTSQSIKVELNPPPAPR